MKVRYVVRPWVVATAMLAALSAQAQPAAKVQASSVDDCVAQANYREGSPRLYPGRYRITLENDSDYGRDKRLEADLYLECDLRHWSKTKTYGYLQATEASLVGIGLGQLSLSPTSRDPNKPGVLVVSDTLGTIIAVGTPGNLRPSRPDEFAIDGGGVWLMVEMASRDEIRGNWIPSGVLATGSGRYEAHRVER